MKKSDKIMIFLVAVTSAIIAFVVAQALFGNVYNGSEKVKTIDRYSATVIEPSEAIFNKDAINPAVQVQINGTK